VAEHVVAPAHGGRKLRANARITLGVLAKVGETEGDVARFVLRDKPGDGLGWFSSISRSPQARRGLIVRAYAGGLGSNPSSQLRIHAGCRELRVRLILPRVSNHSTALSYRFIAIWKAYRPLVTNERLKV
jgi:hypothetical protein